MNFKTRVLEVFLEIMVAFAGVAAACLAIILMLFAATPFVMVWAKIIGIGR